jgi:acid phosphatase class B
MTTKAIIVDIDGTLANVDHRLHFIRGKEREGKGSKDWHSFHDQCVHDQPNHWCLELVNIYKDNGFAIVLLTGRGEDYREQTLKWLTQHKIPFDELHMRPKKTHLPDHEVKCETYQKQIEPKYSVRFVLEDRASVVAMWRDIGLTCLQCAPGDF